MANADFILKKTVKKEMWLLKLFALVMKPCLTENDGYSVKNNFMERV